MISKEDKQFIKDSIHNQPPSLCEKLFTDLGFSEEEVSMIVNMLCKKTNAIKLSLTYHMSKSNIYLKLDRIIDKIFKLVMTMNYNDTIRQEHKILLGIIFKR